MKCRTLALLLILAAGAQAATPTVTVTVTPLPSTPYKILLYYTSFNSDGLTQSKLVPILAAAGHQVTFIDTGSAPYCPTADDWSLYDQVWDARIWYNGYICPVAPLATVDQFDVCWQSKAKAYLQACGKLLLIGDQGYVYHRNEGIVSFLVSAGAGSASLDACMTANGTDVGTDSGPLACALPGVAQAFVDGAGGMPTALLYGSPMIEPASANWTFFPGQKSVAMGWDGTQMPLLGPPCLSGRLYLHMNSSELWAANFDSNPGGQSLSENYFRAVAAWLGNSPCVCVSPTPAIAMPTQSDSYVYPSPVHVGPAYFAFEMSGAGKAKLRILNSAGLRVYENTVRLGPGRQSLSVDTTSYSQGIYFYRIDIDYDSGASAGLPVKAFTVVR